MESRSREGMTMKFGEKLREVREGKGFTRERLSRESGLPFGTIHNYEIGRRAPSFANVVRLAASLGVECTAFAECDDVASDVAPDRPAGKQK